MEKVKGTKTPRNYEAIKNGAMSLSLKERVELLKLLKDSIEAEVEGLKSLAKQAEEIANGYSVEIIENKHQTPL
jgi:hypothetical protein